MSERVAREEGAGGAGGEHLNLPPEDCRESETICSGVTSYYTARDRKRKNGGSGRQGKREYRTF